MALRKLTTIPFGTLVRGGNITVNNQTWPAMWATWDWAGWIKFQIDSAKQYGANCVRVIGGVAGVTDGSYSQATYLARWTQFLDYTASVGVMAYPCGGDFATSHWGATSDQQAADLYAAWAQLCNGYSHVIGLDISNEGFGQGGSAGLSYSQVLSRMTMLTNAVRPVTSKPITHSRAFTQASFWAGTAGSDVKNISDFHDLHVYYDGALAADVDLLLAQPWGDRPVMIGEFGSLGTAIDSPRRVARYAAVASMVADRSEVIGALNWAISDTNSTDLNFSTSGLVAPDGTPRTDLTTAFATLPTQRVITFPRVVSATLGGQLTTLNLVT